MVGSVGPGCTTRGWLVGVGGWLVGGDKNRMVFCGVLSFFVLWCFVFTSGGWKGDEVAYFSWDGKGKARKGNLVVVGVAWGGPAGRWVGA